MTGTGFCVVLVEKVLLYKLNETGCYTSAHVTITQLSDLFLLSSNTSTSLYNPASWTKEAPQESVCFEKWLICKYDTVYLKAQCAR